MKSEEEKIQEAFKKALELIHAINDLKPESQERLANKVAAVTGMNQCLMAFQRMLWNKR